MRQENHRKGMTIPPLFFFSAPPKQVLGRPFDSTMDILENAVSEVAGEPQQFFNNHLKSLLMHVKMKAKDLVPDENLDAGKNAQLLVLAVEEGGQ